MKQRVRLKGGSPFFIGPFRKILEDCGFDPVDGDCVTQPDGSREISIVEVLSKEGLDGLEQPAASLPFLIFTGIGLDDGDVSALRDKGLMGIIRKDTPQEDLYFLINRALFYDRVVKRNPRVQVGIPLELRAGDKTIKSVSSHLSRDGMFIVTINPLQAQTCCELVFDVPGVKTMRTKARVLYSISINKELNIIANPNDPFKRQVSHPGMAVFFEDLPQADRALISEFIKSVK